MNVVFRTLMEETIVNMESNVESQTRNLVSVLQYTNGHFTILYSRHAPRLIFATRDFLQVVAEKPEAFNPRVPHELINKLKLQLAIEELKR